MQTLNQIDPSMINEFLIGMACGLILMRALISLMFFRNIALAALAAGMIYLLAQSGVPGVIALGNTIVAELLGHMAWLRGLLFGHFVIGVYEAVVRYRRHQREIDRRFDGNNNRRNGRRRSA